MALPGAIRPLPARTRAGLGCLLCTAPIELPSGKSSLAPPLTPLAPVLRMTSQPPQGVRRGPPCVAALCADPNRTNTQYKFLRPDDDADVIAKHGWEAWQCVCKAPDCQRKAGWKPEKGSARAASGPRWTAASRRRQRRASHWTRSRRRSDRQLSTRSSRSGRAGVCL
jgi:hypothetical protein